MLAGSRLLYYLYWIDCYIMYVALVVHISAIYIILLGGFQLDVFGGKMGGAYFAGEMIGCKRRSTEGLSL